MQSKPIISRSCPVCDNNVYPHFSHQILGKYFCTYFYCNHCGFLQTEDPYWLNEAYSSAIADGDTGLLQRNIGLSRIIACLIYFLFDSKKKYLDLAGGYGVLTRLMRDRGFDYYWSDKHCLNLLAKGFERRQSDNFFALSALEVLEHLEDPMAFISEALQASESSSLICTTELFNGSPPPSDWWYYAFPTGQHISFYQAKTLKLIAEKLKVNLYSRGSLHVFTKLEIPNLLFRFLTSPLLSRIACLVPTLFMKSKITDDHRAIMDSTGAAHENHFRSPDF